MAVSTTQSIWRSGGGDQTRTAYCGSGVMAAQFYIPAAQANTVTAKVSSAANAPALILPAGAIVMSVTVTTASAATGKTFDMGYAALDGSPSAVAGLINEGAADGISTTFVGSANAAAGAAMGVVMSATEMVYITGGAGATPASSGAVAGTILYYVADPLFGQQSV